MRSHRTRRNLRQLKGAARKSKLRSRHPHSIHPTPRIRSKSPASAKQRTDWSQIGTGLTGLAAVAALVFTGLSLQATRDGQVTDRYNKAVEQLGNRDSIEVRIGGIYALERIAADSDRDHSTVMEVLSAFLRENAPAKSCQAASAGALDAEATAPTTDIQAALTVISRRDTSQEPDRQIDLSNTCLMFADLKNANLEYVNFDDSSLFGADLENADLNRSHFWRTDLTNANLAATNLTNADFRWSNLTQACFLGANLTTIILPGPGTTSTDTKSTRELNEDSLRYDMTGC